MGSIHDGRQLRLSIADDREVRHGRGNTRRPLLGSVYHRLALRNRRRHGRLHTVVATARVRRCGQRGREAGWLQQLYQVAHRDARLCQRPACGGAPLHHRPQPLQALHNRAQVRDARHGVRQQGCQPSRHRRLGLGAITAVRPQRSGWKVHGLHFGCHTGSGVCAGVDSGHRLHQLVGVRDGHGGGLHVRQQSPHVRHRRLAVLGGAGGGCFGLWRVTACPCQRERVLCQHQRLDALPQRGGGLQCGAQPRCDVRAPVVGAAFQLLVQAS